MTFALRPYQHLIVDRIHAQARCNIWAGMGMGKTVSTLTAIDGLYLSGDLSGKVLVLAPLRVARTTWPEEVEKWPHLKHLRVRAIYGQAKQRLRQLKAEADIYTINYEQLPWLGQQYERYGWPWPFEMIVADESTRLKSFRLGGGKGKRARAIARFAWKAKRWVNLTGTPSPNGVRDLWGQQWFIDKGASLGSSFTAFEDRWFRKIPAGIGYFKTEALDHAHDEMKALIGPSTLTVRPEDWFDLKEPIVTDVAVDLPQKAAALYRKLEREYFVELISGKEIEAVNAAAKSMKLLQMANGAVYTDDQGAYETVHDAKIDALRSVVEEAGGAPILVAYHFKTDRDRILKAFPKAQLLDKKPKTLRDWNAGKIQMLLAHPASAGHGLNLQDGGNILVFFGHWWALEEHDQIIERIGPVRQLQAGHNRNVFIYYITARGTLDSAVIDRRVNKRSVQDALLAACRHFEDRERAA